MTTPAVNRGFLVTGLLLCFAACLYAQKSSIDPSLYQASAIPAELKKDANAVVRHQEMSITIKAANKVQMEHHSVVTILNEKAEKEAFMTLGYDKKYSTINNAELIAYDATGKLIKRYRKGDMYDRSAVDGISIITDSRILAAGHQVVSYPVTVEKKFGMTITSFLDLPDWLIQDEDMAVQHSALRVLVNPAVGFRYKMKNVVLNPAKGSSDGLDTYTWEVKNLPAMVPEINSPYWKVLPRLSLATNNIEFDGIPGDMSTWAGFGMWQKKLCDGTATLHEARVNQIREMVAGLSTDKEKAKFLYNYVQKNFRYVSIQLGIGGLKPFPASFVDEKRYGDCKALVNYMHTLLKAVNIRSHYTLIRAGENEEPADADFVNDPFNHIVLCIPFEKDTTWLECTSNTAAFGRLGTFTENRTALLITEDGGKLVKTPASKMDDNRFSSDARITITPEGIAQAKVKIEATGEYRDMYVGMSSQKTDEQKKFLMRYLNLRQPDVFEFAHLDDAEGRKTLELNLAYEKLSDMASGNKYFYRPRILDLWTQTLPPAGNRKSDFFFSHPMAKSSTTTIEIPDGLEVEALPANVKLQFGHGSFETTYAYDKEKNEVNALSEFKIWDHVIPAKEYNEMQAFMDNIAKSMNAKLIIRKKS